MVIRAAILQAASGLRTLEQASAGSIRQFFNTATVAFALKLKGGCTLDPAALVRAVDSGFGA
jgi:hypothetical protein